MKYDEGMWRFLKYVVQDCEAEARRLDERAAHMPDESAPEAAYMKARAAGLRAEAQSLRDQLRERGLEPDDE